MSFFVFFCFYSFSHFFSLVTKEPRVTTQSSIFNLTVGEPVDLFCSYNDSFPMVTKVYWRQAWSLIPNSDRAIKNWSGTDFSLMITNATIYDLGKYQCLVGTPIFWKHATIIVGGK